MRKRDSETVTSFTYRRKPHIQFINDGEEMVDFLAFGASTVKVI